MVSSEWLISITMILLGCGCCLLSDDISSFNGSNIEPYPTKLSKPEDEIYILAMVADNDHKSKLDDNTFISYIQHCKLTINNDQYSIEFIPPPFSNAYDMSQNKNNFNYIQLESKYGRKARGMELSELTMMNGHLLTIDDRTGIVYEITTNFEMIPRTQIKEFENNQFKEKGLKVEWSTIKNDLLYIGSFGKEYTNTKGTIVKKLTTNYIVTYNITTNKLKYINWGDIYHKMRLKTGTLFPGYLWHEAIEWSDIHKKWFILPRYISFDFYDEDITELKGSNLLLIVSEDFNDIQFVWIGKNGKFPKNNEDEIISVLDNDKYKQFDNKDIDLPYATVFDLNDEELQGIRRIQNEMRKELVYSNRGFSSMTFLPGTNDRVIIALKTAENVFYECEVDHDAESCTGSVKRIQAKSYIMIFDVDGNIILDDVTVPSENSYEGIVVL